MKAFPEFEKQIMIKIFDDYDRSTSAGGVGDSNARVGGGGARNKSYSPTRYPSSPGSMSGAACARRLLPGRTGL